MKYKFKLKGLDCANCAASLEEKLSKIEGVQAIVISFMMEKMTVTCQEDVLEKVKAMIKKEEPDVSLEEV